MRKTQFLYCLFVATLILTQLQPLTVSAQWNKIPPIDTSYFVDYPQHITGRVYLSRKYTTFKIPSVEGKTDLKYRPNTTLNLGIGATYHNFSLNLALGVKFLNPEDGKGETKYLDLQAHNYPRGWAIDCYGQFYRGYYLHPKGYGSTNGDYYLRPDARVNLFGLSVYRIFNSGKFSYNAAFIQNEWQRKSAGSLLLGVEAFFGNIVADSAFVPVNLKNDFQQSDIGEARFYAIGPGGGYAYTLVIKEHFFITGSGILNLNIGYSTEKGNNKTTSIFYANPTTTFRLVMGYNSPTWNISANWVGNRLRIASGSSDRDYSLATGNYRLVFAKKIMPGPKTKKLLRPIDKILK